MYEFIESYTYTHKRPSVTFSLNNNLKELREAFEANRDLSDDSDINVADGFRVRFNKDGLTEVLDEIITNAEKRAFVNTPNSQANEVRIELKSYSDQVHIEVLNNGEPLPIDFNEEQSFLRGYSRGKEKGTGYGLGHIKDICTEMNAKITWINTPSDVYKVGMKISFNI